MLTMARLPVIGFLALLTGLASSQATAQASHEVVFCFNEAAGTVLETLASDCRGKVVTENEAATIRNRRQDYIRKVLTRTPDTRLQGMTLAGIGSGFFISDNGTVLTNDHVVADCSAVSVTPTFGEMAVAQEVVSAGTVDLALVLTAMDPPRVASFVETSGPATIGSTFVVGYPEHGLTTITPVLTTVEVMRREGNTQHGPAIVLRGDVRRGNSGGPLLDSSGNVIGVVTAKVDSVSVYNATGALVRHIGLALPNDRVQGFLNAQGVLYNRDQRWPILDADRLLEEVAPFVVRIGCWK